MCFLYLWSNGRVCFMNRKHSVIKTKSDDLKNDINIYLWLTCECIIGQKSEMCAATHTQSVGHHTSSCCISDFTFSRKRNSGKSAIVFSERVGSLCPFDFYWFHNGHLCMVGICASVCVYVVVRHLSNDQITARNDLINNNGIDITVFSEYIK